MAVEGLTRGEQKIERSPNEFVRLCSAKDLKEGPAARARGGLPCLHGGRDAIDWPRSRGSRRQWRATRRGDDSDHSVRTKRGYSTEAVVVIALLVALAILAVGIITAKVIATANAIQTG